MLQRELYLNNELFFAEVARLLEAGDTVTLRARGESMFPFMVEGRDQVELGRCAEVAVGDIVLVRLPGRGFVLHRIYAIEGGRLRLMGDGNLRAVEYCRADEVLARVERIIRRGRTVSCSSRSERLKALLWRRLLPLRRLLLFVCRRMIRK